MVLGVLIPEVEEVEMMIIAGFTQVLITQGSEGALSEETGVRLISYPMTVNDGDELLIINNEDELADWADRNFDNWDIKTI